MTANRTTDNGGRSAENPSRAICRLSSVPVLLWTDHDIRRVGMLHADYMIAGIDVVHLAGHAARHVGQKIGAGLADLLDGHAAAQRRVVLVPLQNIAEVAATGGGARLD